MEERIDFLENLYKSKKLLKCAAYSLWYNEYFAKNYSLSEWKKWNNLYGLKILKDETKFDEIENKLKSLNLPYLNNANVLASVRKYLFSLPIDSSKLCIMETCYKVNSVFYKINDGDGLNKHSFETNKISQKIYRYVIKQHKF